MSDPRRNIQRPSSKGSIEAPRSTERAKSTESSVEERASSPGVSSLAAIERALESVVHRLSQPNPTPQSRELLIEARRLKSLVGSWHSIPPHDDARREMLSRVSRLTARVPVPGDDQRSRTEPGLTRAEVPLRRASGTGLPAVPGASRAAPAPSSATVLRTRMMAWRPLRGVEGIDVKVIRRDGPLQTIAVLRMDVGTEVSTEALGGGAEIYVVSGEVSLGGTQLHRGDVWGPADDVTRPGLLTTATGAELLVLGWDDTAAWV